MVSVAAATPSIVSGRTSIPWMLAARANQRRPPRPWPGYGRSRLGTNDRLDIRTSPRSAGGGRRVHLPGHARRLHPLTPADPHVVDPLRIPTGQWTVGR